MLRDHGANQVLAVMSDKLQLSETNIVLQSDQGGLNGTDQQTESGKNDGGQIENAATRCENGSQFQTLDAENSQEGGRDAVCRLETPGATRLAILRVIGEGARIHITRCSESHEIRYQSVKSDTGEIIQDWSQEDYIRLIRGVRDDVLHDVDQGLLLEDRL